MAQSPRVIVVGAGIVGASIAWHLKQRGADVTVLAETAGGTATPNSFGWINASWGNPEQYFRLRIRSMAEWRRLAQALPELPLTMRGGLCFDLPPAELERYREEHASWGYTLRRVGRSEIERIEPNLAAVPDSALFADEEGAVEPQAAARIMLNAAAEAGAAIEIATANALIGAGGRIAGVETSDGPIPADFVVLAAGVGAAALAGSVGINVPLDTPPGLIVHSRPHKRLINTVVTAPELHMRQTADGRIIAGGDYAGSEPGPHPEKTAAVLFDKLRDTLRGADELALDFFTVGWRPTPLDGFPIIGGLEDRPGLYIAVTHSGVTLAPVIGLFAAEEILTGRRDPLLEPYGLSRFG